MQGYAGILSNLHVDPKIELHETHLSHVNVSICSFCCFPDYICNMFQRGMWIAGNCLQIEFEIMWKTVPQTTHLEMVYTIFFYGWSGNVFFVLRKLHRTTHAILKFKHIAITFLHVKINCMNSIWWVRKFEPVTRSAGHFLRSLSRDTQVWFGSPYSKRLLPLAWRFKAAITHRVLFTG